MKKILSALVLVLIFAAGSLSVFAQAPGGTGSGPGSGGTGNGPGSLLQNPFKPSIGNSVPALLSSLLNDVVLPVGAVLCVFAFIFAGFQYVTAQGNPAKIGKANQALLYAAIGTVVLLGSWVIAKALCNTIHELGGPACPAKL